jgi:PAS domain S-box-containing protein
MQHRRLSEDERIRLSALAVNSINDTVCVTDTNGVIILVNPAFLRTYGYEDEEIVGRHVSTLWADDEAPSRGGELEEDAPTGGLSDERLHRRKDGSVFPAFVSTSAVHDDSGMSIANIGIGHDLTPVRDAVTALREREQQLADAQRVARLGSFTWSIEDDDTAVWSDEFYRILGLDHNEAPSLERFIAVVDTVDKKRVRNVIRASIEQKAPLNETMWIVTSDGRRKSLEVRGEVVTNSQDRVIAMVGSLQDVTDVKRTEAALRDSEAKASAILETTVDGIITIDERGTIRSFNPAAERIFGYSADEAIGESVGLLMPPDYSEQHDDYVQSYLETGQRKIIGIGREVIGQRKNGATFPMELAVSEVHLAGARIFTGIVRDISQRRRLEREILRVTDLERQRIGQDLHDGLGQMLTGIGLIGQNLAARLRKKGDPEASNVEELAVLIQEADEYARTLARGIIPVELDRQGLAPALRRLADNSTRLFGVDVQFDDVGDGTLEDNNVASHLYRIAQEGLSNAVRHGEASQVKIRLARGSDHIRLRVTDNGKGIPELTDGQHPGMGLRIMLHRARMIGATLDVRSGEGVGTVVTCTVPIENASTSPESAISNERAVSNVQ